MFCTAQELTMFHKQVFLSPNFGTDIGICTSLAPIVHDETEWSDVPSPFGTWVQAGVYPSEENGVAIILGNVLTFYTLFIFLAKNKNLKNKSRFIIQS